MHRKKVTCYISGCAMSWSVWCHGSAMSWYIWWVHDVMVCVMSWSVWCHGSAMSWYVWWVCHVMDVWWISHYPLRCLDYNIVWCCRKVVSTEWGYCEKVCGRHGPRAGDLARCGCQEQCGYHYVWLVCQVCIYMYFIIELLMSPKYLMKKGASNQDSYIMLH